MGLEHFYICDGCGKQPLQYSEKTNLEVQNKTDNYRSEDRYYLCNSCIAKIQATLKSLKGTNEKPVENSSPVGYTQQPPECNSTGGGRVSIWRRLYDKWTQAV